MPIVHVHHSHESRERGMTEPEKARMAALYSMHQVMRLLGWDEETYCWDQYKTGLKYLELYTGKDPVAMAHLEREKRFWSWWKNHWAMRNEDFISVAWKLPRWKLHYFYIELHNPYDLAREITPHGRMLGDSYAVMIGKCMDKVPD